MRILSLCDYTANMLKPWAEAGHDCTAVDIEYKDDYVCDQGIRRLRRDVLSWRPNFIYPAYDIIFAFPPCTHLASSGARWWAGKGLSATIEALQLVKACQVICEGYTNEDGWWILENPVGRLSTAWRKPDYMFDPCDYGDDYTKKTCLWTAGTFVMPEKNRVPATAGSKMHTLPASKDRARLRSETPMGFARAVYEANKP